MKKRTNKPSKVLGRRSLIVAYPYIHERLRRGRYHNIGQLPEVDDNSQVEQRAIRLMSDEVLPPVIPPKGIDLDQWESFYLEFERLLPHGGDDDDDDCNDGERGSSQSLERKNDDSALLWSKDGGLAELKARREDRARRAMSGSSKSVEDTVAAVIDAVS
jgi:hypothetical protein